MRKAIALIALALGGCSLTTAIEQKIGNDASGAQALAMLDVTDPQAPGRAACYGAFARLSNALAPPAPAMSMATPVGGVSLGAPPSGGIFTTVEAGIEIEGVINSPTCQQIAGQVLIFALHKAPFGNLLP